MKKYHCYHIFFYFVVFIKWEIPKEQLVQCNNKKTIKIPEIENKIKN